MEKEQTFQNNCFSKSDSVITKGICILIILVHHLFFYQFFGNEVQKEFIFPHFTKVLTGYGFCLNHVFFAITGYGIAMKLDKEEILPIIIKREKSIFILFIPVFIFSCILYLIFMKSSINSFLQNVYGAGKIKAIGYFLIDSFTLADLGKTPTLNPTWWFLSATQFVIFGSLIIFSIAKKSNLLFVIYFFLIMCQIHYGVDNLYVNCLIAGITGGGIYMYSVIERISSCFKNMRFGIIIEAILLLFLCFVWYVLKSFVDIHFISAILIPIIVFCFIHDYVSKVKYISLFFYKVGSISSYIFLLHTMFYLIVTPIRNFCYSFKYAIVTYLLVLGLSILSGVLIKECVNLTNKIFTKVLKRENENSISNRKF